MLFVGVWYSVHSTHAEIDIIFETVCQLSLVSTVNILYIPI